MGLVGGDRDPERLHGILPGDEGGPLLPDRVEEVLELPAHGFLLSHMDLLLVVFERNLVKVERVQRPEGAGTHGDRLLRVVDLDEVLQAGQGELPHLHRREPVHLDEAVDAVVKPKEDVRVVLEIPVELPSPEGEYALDRSADEEPEDVDLVHAEIHDHPDVADAPGEGTDATRGRGYEVSVLPLLQVAFHGRDRGIVSLDVSHRERDPGALCGVDDLTRLLGGGRERLDRKSVV